MNLHTIKAQIGTLLSFISGLFSWVSESITIEWISGVSAVVTSVFACIHFYHSWQLKKIEKAHKVAQYKKYLSDNP